MAERARSVGTSTAPASGGDAPATTGPPTPCRLLIVGIRWPPETFIQRLIRGLTRAGVDVTVASRDRVHTGDEYAGRLHWLPTPTWTGTSPARVLRSAWTAVGATLARRDDWHGLRAFIREGHGVVRKVQRAHAVLPFERTRADVIYFPWNSAAITYQPLFELGIPVVVSCRGAQVNIAPLSPHNTRIQHGLRATFDRAAAVHCVSEDILCEAEQLGLDRAKARVIRPAVDPARFCPGERSNGAGDFQVVSTGSVIWRKGYDYALQSVRVLIDRGVSAQLDIIGDGEDRERTLYTIRDLGLSGLVTLHGRMSPDEVVRCLQRADAFLLSSLSEGISNAVLEAMACGLPVVTTDCGGMREAVTDGVEGFVTPVRDSVAMADALARLAGDRELRARMGQAGRDRIEREFALDRQVEQWLDLLVHVAGPGAPDVGATRR